MERIIYRYQSATTVSMVVFVICVLLLTPTVLVHAIDLPQRDSPEIEIRRDINPQFQGGIGNSPQREVPHGKIDDERQRIEEAVDRMNRNLNTPDLEVHSVRLMPVDRAVSVYGDYYEAGRAEDLEVRVVIINNNVIYRSYDGIQVSLIGQNGRSWTRSVNLDAGIGDNIRGADGQTVEAVFRFNSSGLQDGINELRAVADPNNRILEPDEENNEFETLLRIRKADLESDVPLPQAPLISAISQYPDRTVIQGTYNSSYGSATVELLINDEPQVATRTGAQNGRYSMSTRQSIMARDHLKVRLRARQGGQDSPYQIADSREYRLSEFDERGTVEIIGTPTEGDSEVIIGYTQQGESITVKLYRGERNFRSGPFIIAEPEGNGRARARLDSPLTAGERLKSGVTVDGHRIEGEIITVDPAEDVPPPNASIGNLVILSDRDDNEIRDVPARGGYRIRFTIRNTGPGHLRDLPLRIDASNSVHEDIIRGEMRPGESREYTSNDIFTARREGMERVRVDLDPDNSIAEENENDNRAELQLTVTAAGPDPADNLVDNDDVVERIQQPDLLITGIQTRPPNPNSGDTADILVTVRNQGAAPAPVGVELGAHRIDIGDQRYMLEATTTEEITPGASTTINVGSMMMRPLERNIEAGVNYRGMLVESEVNNNFFHGQLMMRTPPDGMPDLTIQYARVSPGRIVEGQGHWTYDVTGVDEITISTDISNINPVDEAVGDIEVRVSDGRGITGEATAHFPDPCGGCSETVDVRVNTSRLATGIYELRVEADPRNRIHESNENNNRVAETVYIMKSGPLSEVPLPAVPVITEIFTVVNEDMTDMYIRGTYNRTYRNATIQLIRDDNEGTPWLADDGRFEIRTGELLWYDRLKVRLKAQQIGNETFQTADSLEYQVRDIWNRNQPQIAGELREGQNEVRILYSDIHHEQSLRLYRGVSEGSRGIFFNPYSMENGTAVVRLDEPLQAGERLRPSLLAGNITVDGPVLTVIGEEAQPLPNALIENLEILSDRADEPAADLHDGSGVRIRFTVSNPGRGIIRDLMYRVEAAGGQYEAFIPGEILPDGHLAYTPDRIFIMREGSNLVSVRLDPRGRIRETSEDDNTAEESIRASAGGPEPDEHIAVDRDEEEVVVRRPDLVIDEIRTDPVRPHSGDTVDVYVTIANRGNTATGPGIGVGVDPVGDDVYRLIGSVQGALEPGERAVVHVGHRTVTPRTNRIVAAVDFLQRHYEIDERNNTSSIMLDIPEPPADSVDLAVDSVNVNDARRSYPSGSGYVYEVDPDSRIRIHVGVGNLNPGIEPLGQVNVRLSDDRGWEGTVSVDMGNVNNVQTATLVLDGEDLGSGWHEFHAYVDPDNRIVESNEANNRTYAPLRILSVQEYSDEPLPVAPSIDSAAILINNGFAETVIRGTYNSAYRDATVQLILNDRPGSSVIGRDGSFEIATSPLYYWARLKVTVRARTPDNPDGPFRTAESLEYTASDLWTGDAPEIAGPLVEGQEEVAVRYNPAHQNFRLKVFRGNFQYTVNEKDNGTGIYRFGSPLRAGEQVSARMYFGMDRDDHTYSMVGQTVTVDPAGGQPVSNVRVEGLAVLSDRSDEELISAVAGAGFRPRFTVVNTGEGIVRDVPVRIEASGVREDIVLGGEIAAGQSREYTSTQIYSARPDTGTLRVTLDPDNTIGETNENDNIADHRFFIQSPIVAEIAAQRQDDERAPGARGEFGLREGLRTDNDVDLASAANKTGTGNVRFVSRKVTLLQVRSLIAAAQGTNPFDYREVEDDVEEAQQVPDNTPAASPAANPYPVALSATFMGPYMAFPGDSIYLPVEEGGAGTNTLGDFTATPGAGTALRIENQADTMMNSFVGFFADTDWTIISQSVPNPVPDVDVSLIVRRNSDNNYFKVTLNLYGSASSIDVFTLSGFNCGPLQADCP